MISKELLSEITNISISNIVKIREGNSLLEVTKANGAWIEYNNYELAYECKRWAFNKGYKIIEEVGRVIVKNKNDEFLNAIHSPLDKLYSIERCFQACEWILKTNNYQVLP